MEIFIDGGLFELGVLFILAAGLNFIFLRRIALIFYSAIVIALPLSLFLIRRGELYFTLLSFCLLNSTLLVVLLWREKIKHPNQPLFPLPPGIKKRQKKA